MKLKDIKGLVIHCKTKEEATQLIEATGIDSHWITNWGTYCDDTCYRFDNDNDIVGYAFIEYYKTNGYTITEFSDLIIPEEPEAPLTAKEAFEWLKEHYVDGEYRKVFGSDMTFYEIITTFGVDDIVKRLSDWKKEHETPKIDVKPIEFEWAYICRIIKVENNGVKKCVYEEEFEPTSFVEDDAVDTILRKYISEHEGKYFATVEHIYRVKE